MSMTELGKQYPEIVQWCCECDGMQTNAVLGGGLFECQECGHVTEVSAA